MKQRLASPSALIDLGKVEGLSGIELKGRSLVIGATTKHAEVATSRHRAAGDPRPCGPRQPHRRPRGAQPRHHRRLDRQQRSRRRLSGGCLALNATIVTNKRKIPADEFFTGLFDTALEAGEIVVKVSFPIPSRAAYAKFRNPASRYALVGVFVAKRGSDVRVAVTGAGQNGVFRATALEEALKKRFSPEVARRHRRSRHPASTAISMPRRNIAPTSSP